MTCVGPTYGKPDSTLSLGSGNVEKRQEISSSAGLDTDAVASSVSDAVSSATDRLQAADLSLNSFQENLFAISMTWHFVIQFAVIYLLSEVIAPIEEKDDKAKKDGKESAEEPADDGSEDDDGITFKKAVKGLPKAIFKGIPLLIFRSTKDSIKKLYRMIRRAKKWTYIRLGLICALGLVMLLVARQLSSLAHIIRDPSAEPWSEWPDITILHDTLLANTADLAAGERLLMISFCFWFMSITASVYCMSCLADRPAPVPVDEEKAVTSKELVYS